MAVHDEEGKLVRTLEHADEPTLLGFDPAGRSLAAVGQKGPGPRWSLASGKDSAPWRFRKRRVATPPSPHSR